MLRSEEDGGGLGHLEYGWAPCGAWGRCVTRSQERRGGRQAEMTEELGDNRRSGQKRQHDHRRLAPAALDLMGCGALPRPVVAKEIDPGHWCRHRTVLHLARLE